MDAAASRHTTSITTGLASAAAAVLVAGRPSPSCRGFRFLTRPPRSAVGRVAGPFPTGPFFSPPDARPRRSGRNYRLTAVFRLKSNVATPLERQLAYTAANQVPGIFEVRNELQVDSD